MDKAEQRAILEAIARDPKTYPRDKIAAIKALRDGSHKPDRPKDARTGARGADDVNEARRVHPPLLRAGPSGLPGGLAPRAVRNEDGERVHTQALWGVPRGNGKTEIAAAVALYMLVADMRRAEVYIAAGSREIRRLWRSRRRSGWSRTVRWCRRSRSSPATGG